MTSQQPTSEILHGRHLLLSTYEKEMTPILSIQKWRHYSLGGHFVIKADHARLKHLWEQRLSTVAHQIIGIRSL